jgi:hypothetical protein
MIKILQKWFLKVLSNLKIHKIILGARGSVVVKALCCKPEGRGFETRLR